MKWMLALFLRRVKNNKRSEINMKSGRKFQKKSIDSFQSELDKAFGKTPKIFKKAIRLALKKNRELNITQKI